MLILGIDPGTATTGYGVIRQTAKSGEYELVDFGAVETSKDLTDAERLLIVADDIKSLIKKHTPSVIGVEKLFFTTNKKTAMTVSQARGAILLVAQQHNIPILEFTPLQIKSFICGYGKAEKKQVQYIVQKTFKLTKPPRPDDAADALAVALCAAHFFNKKKFLK